MRKLILVALFGMAAMLPAAAQSARIFALRSADGTVVASFAVRDSSVFTHTGTESGWMSPTQSCMLVEGHPAVIAKQAQMDAWFRHWLDSTKAMRANTPPPTGVVTSLTSDTQMIEGLHARRVEVTLDGHVQSVIWVLADAVPHRLRESQQLFVDSIPPDYWQRVNGGPGYTEIISLYGVPIRHEFADGKMLEATVRTDSMPGWATDIEASCNSAVH